MHFDEKSMFAGHKLEAKTLKVKTKAATSTYEHQHMKLCSVSILYYTSPPYVKVQLCVCLCTIHSVVL